MNKMLEGVKLQASQSSSHSSTPPQCLSLLVCRFEEKRAVFCGLYIPRVELSGNWGTYLHLKPHQISTMIGWDGRPGSQCGEERARGRALQGAPVHRVPSPRPPSPKPPSTKPLSTFHRCFTTFAAVTNQFLRTWSLTHCCVITVTMHYFSRTAQRWACLERCEKEISC